MSDRNHVMDPDHPQMVLRQRFENSRNSEIEAQAKLEAEMEAQAKLKAEKARKDRKEDLREARRVRAAERRAANPQWRPKPRPEPRFPVIIGQDCAIPSAYELQKVIELEDIPHVYSSTVVPFWDSDDWEGPPKDVQYCDLSMDQLHKVKERFPNGTKITIKFHGQDRCAWKAANV